MSEVRVRPAKPEDALTIVRFIRGLAEFEREPHSSVKVTEAEIVVQGANDLTSTATIEDHAQTDPSAQNVPTVQVAMTKASENVAPDVLPVVMMVAADDRIRPVAAKLSK